MVCPWCYIGKRRFDRALDQLAAEIPDVQDMIEIVYRAYQLDPTAPVGQPTPVRDVYARKFGGYERAEAIFEQMTTTAADEGIRFDFSSALRANTSRAHRLLWWTLQEHGAATQAALKEDIMAAYFTHGRDVGDIDTLAEIAHARLSAVEQIHQDVSLDSVREFLISDLGEAEVRADIAEAAANGITGVPTYVVDGQWAIPGAQDSDTFARVLRRTLERRTAGLESAENG